MGENEQVSLGVREVTPEVIETIKRRIVAAIHPRQIILFGSQARQDAGSASDVDLLVVHDTSRTGGCALPTKTSRDTSKRWCSTDCLIRSC